MGRRSGVERIPRHARRAFLPALWPRHLILSLPGEMPCGLGATGCGWRRASRSVPPRGGSNCWPPTLESTPSANGPASCSGCRAGRASSIRSIRSRDMPMAARSRRSRRRPPGVMISEHLPKLAKQMDRAAVIRSMYTKEGDHNRATVADADRLSAAGTDPLSEHRLALFQGADGTGLPRCRPS